MYRQRYYFEYIPIEDIVTQDRTFCLSYPLFDDILTESIRRFGIIQPIIVFDSEPYIVITGFKRLESALSLGFEEIPCIIRQVGQMDALLIAVNDNLTRGFNIVEKAHCVDKMMQLGFSMEEVYDLMGRIGLGRHESVVKSLIGLSWAETELKDFVLRHRLSMKNIDYLLWFDPNEREKIIAYLSGISFTDSLLREILEMLSLTKLKKGSLPEGELEGAKDAFEIRKRLKRYVNPGISSLDGEFKKLKESCGFPKNIDIKVDPFFEKEYIDIIIKADSLDKVRDGLKKIEGAIEKGYMEGIFGLTKSRIHRDED
ncbi:MAG TPA: ParB N-terminal domain-containing protein [Syntrophorhabdaceae bacterium]|nr:ParB N-terminal domain-containing protein [Syntrophorhabdaceae bacterium]HOL05799.1 ParB N-terminal domain-containing protein [Syntrophorhabdaceae bacterium]HPC66812.1 ParB N-terminal domain-containing protein [Syntrophorhabdaceae bacterium]HPP41459.1 ParB N-terminal domain-containing protein [Syntrophorhabdaceae bacterium]HQH43491.1 ParB N-terminal domain-containing protein [Syntrophorhabdaceae bacterium]